jgi:hypothetical protein
MTAIMRPRRLLCLMMLGPFVGLSGCMGGGISVLTFPEISIGVY